MTGIDTNILVRYLTEDDEAQFLAALNLLNEKGAKFFVPDLVLVELDWVLSSLYEWTRHEIAEALAKLLTVHNLLFENEGRILSALKAVRSGADLSDELIAEKCQSHGCRDFATFDKAAAKRHKGFARIPS